MSSPLRNESCALTASNIQELKDIHVKIAAVVNLGIFAFEIQGFKGQADNTSDFFVFPDVSSVSKVVNVINDSTNF